MSPVRLTFLTTLAMLAFAANSLLNRMALTETGLDAGSFTLIRVFSAAAFLVLLTLLRGRSATALVQAGSWPSALVLLLYAAGFSFAYLHLTAATGALLLFGAVQATMIAWGLCSSVLVVLLSIIPLTIGRIKAGYSIKNMSAPRAFFDQLPNFGKRAVWCHQNCWESITLHAPASLLCIYLFRDIVQDLTHRWAKDPASLQLTLFRSLLSH